MANWVITEPGKTPPRVSAESAKEKIPFISQARTTAEMTDGQKEFIRLYNLMRNALLKNGLMEEKQ